MEFKTLLHLNLLAIPHGGWFDSLPIPRRLVVRRGIFFVCLVLKKLTINQLHQGEEDENKTTHPEQ